MCESLSVIQDLASAWRIFGTFCQEYPEHGGKDGVDTNCCIPHKYCLICLFAIGVTIPRNKVVVCPQCDWL